MSAGARARGTFLVDVGGVLGAWLVLLSIENLIVGFGWRAQFVGTWEMAHARQFLTPIAIGTALPLAGIAVAFGRLIAARHARAVGVVAGVIGLAVALGVTRGRHFESLALRVPFVLVVGLAAAAASALLTRRLPLGRPRLLALLGAVVTCVAWAADATLLPRLYPAFHAALFGLTLAGSAALYLVVRGRAIRRGESPAWRRVALGALGVSAASLLWTPHAARAVMRDDNLRRVLIEHAPILGRAVLLASRIAPPPPIDEDAAEARTTAALVRPKASARSLDWTDHDVVLVTIDALRADHLSSYGYPRATSPNIDRLAARGARFEHAYCPTPHTSYSITSMMTGKYMRPLLSMGVGDDSETWAGYLRHYGFRTAAFYPPAVFFIDAHRFTRMKAEGLGFEYRKEEFAAPALRRAQIADYVAKAPADKPLFLWVHLFEPHEPYVKHPEHVFGDGESVDAYDSEIATADDEVGMIVDVVEKRRPGAVFMVSADHGEEFDDHGGRYHGTSVYEEQVRVPLVIVGPGIAPGSVVTTPVQTIDLLPTTLEALDVPEPSRVRGRDLGPLLARTAGPAEPGASPDPGLAFAETDDYTLVARGDERLVCVRKIASCTLFDVRADPKETKPIQDRPERVQELRRITAAIVRENGKLEAGGMPEALRRGLQGDQDAAEDVSALLDDARVDIRREAARCAFRLKAPVMAPQLERALRKDEDAQVKRWSALALLRLGANARANADAGANANADAGTNANTAEALLRDADPRFRAAAALALAEGGDGRGEAELVRRWETAFAPHAREPGELDEARELLAALEKIHARNAAPALARSLEDVRLRSYIATTLGRLDDARAVPALLATFTQERYVDARPKEARALVALGARDALLAPLERFAGVPEPMFEAVALARSAGLLVPGRGGWRAPTGSAPPQASVDLTAPAGEGAARLFVLETDDAPDGGAGAAAATNAPDDAGAASAMTASVDGAAVSLEPHGAVWIAELPSPSARAHVRVRVEAVSARGVAALWLVRRAEEIPPPAPREWQPSAPSTAPEGGL